MPPQAKRVKVARQNKCDDFQDDERINEMNSQIEALKKENQRLLEENQQMTEKNNRFPELLAVWRNRYEEAMNKNVSKVVMHGGDVFLPMGVHLREMRTVDMWKKRFENEQKLRKELEKFIEKWKKNNNELRKNLEIEEKAHKKTKKLLDMLMPDDSGHQPNQSEFDEDRKDVIQLPIPLNEIKEEEPSTSAFPVTPNEMLTKLAIFKKINNC